MSVLTFHLVYKPPSFHLLRLLQPVRYVDSFVVPFGRSFSFNSFLSFVTVFLSFQLSPFIRYFIPFVSTLTSRSLLLPFVSSRSLLAVVQEISYLGDYNKSIQPNYDKNSSLPFGWKTWYGSNQKCWKSGGAVPRVCYTQAVNSGKHRETNQHPRKKWYESKIYQHPR